MIFSINDNNRASVENLLKSFENQEASEGSHIDNGNTIQLESNYSNKTPAEGFTSNQTAQKTATQARLEFEAQTNNAMQAQSPAIKTAIAQIDAEGQKLEKQKKTLETFDTYVSISERFSREDLELIVEHLGSIKTTSPGIKNHLRFFEDLLDKRKASFDPAQTQTTSWPITSVLKTAAAAGLGYMVGKTQSPKKDLNKILPLFAACVVLEIDQQSGTSQKVYQKAKQLLETINNKVRNAFEKGREFVTNHRNLVFAGVGLGAVALGGYTCFSAKQPQSEQSSMNPIEIETAADEAKTAFIELSLESIRPPEKETDHLKTLNVPQLFQETLSQSLWNYALESKTFTRKA